MKTGRPRKHPMLKTEKYARAQEGGELKPLQNPDVPPSILNEEAKKFWSEFIPRLAKANKVFEIHRMICCVLSDSLATYFHEEELLRNEKLIKVRNEPKDLRLAAETILDFCREVGITPLTQHKTVGLNGSTQPIESRKR